MNFKIKALLIISLAILSTMKANAETYIDQEYGLKFDIGQLVLSKSESTPAITRFTSGKTPFSVSVQYKLVHGNLIIDEFINNEREKNIEYPTDSKVTFTHLNIDGFDAYELNRIHELGNIHWLVFQKKGDKRIYCFWLLENKKLSKENKVALSSYYSMKNSLTAFQGSAPTDIQLSNKVEIEDILKLHKKMKKVSKSVTSCVDSGNEHSACVCKNIIVINELKVAVNSIFIKYPSWLSARTLNFNLSNNENVVINPSALNTHLSKEIPCSK